ncbi:MAG: magnesium transporter [Deltaproteobacteria bacterium]|nr:magnesium transporter [Deltaproteobacteria bacterium]NND28395.1 magnesium transporter [Myxococcales bacterium]MBT8465981.1 magnesium transporter [Deltaproteobacteria bacterium]MBT8483280.1 magnesium transporter [Deltaproteobacteria bacterium]NNK05737.1 magnesium transporter [Myxococcales bacterium]
MRLAPLIGPDLQDAIAIGPEAVREAVSEFHAEDIAELLEDLSAREAVTLVRALPTETAADVVERLSPSRQVLVFNAIDTGRAVELLGEMDPDDRVDLLQELEEDDAAALLTALERREPEAAEEVRELVQYEPETAGGLMTTQFASLPPETKAWEAMEAARRFGREEMAEMLYYIYVCRPSGELLGVVSLRDLILSEPAQPLSEIMVENVFKVSAFDDQEQVADAIARYDLAALPVVDRLSRMLGVVTIDDVVDVVIEEATEDAQKMGGVVPLEESYFDTSWAEFVWKRGSWLVLLFIAQLLTATVIRQNQDFLAATVELVLFIPLIIASGGNAGSQSATLIIRAMAVGELRPGDWAKVAGRELLIGLSLGIALGLIGFARGWFAGETVEPIAIATAVGASILAIVTLSTMIGSLLPLLIRRAGLDPAVSSTPFIASVVDVLGLVVYFAVAQVILHVVFGS